MLHISQRHTLLWIFAPTGRRNQRMRMQLIQFDPRIAQFRTIPNLDSTQYHPHILV